MKSDWLLKKFFSVLFLLVFIFSITCPLPVNAEDLPPIEQTAQEESAPPAAEEQSTAQDEEQPASPSEQQSQPPKIELSSTEEAAVIPALIEESIISEVLDQLPADINIVAVGSDGQPDPLASQEAAATIVEGDPMWCPEGSTHGSQCVNAASFSALLPLLDGKTGNGTIYFMPTNTISLTIDGTNEYLSGLNDLTIQGGWNGSTSGVITYSGKSLFNSTLTIRNWVGDISINDIAMSLPGAVQSDGYGVNVISNAGLTITDVTGNITISDSQFNNISLFKAPGGIISGSSGDVTITNSQFNGNSKSGLIIQNRTGTVTISDSTFNNNGLPNNYSGLEISGITGNVSLSNITSNGNGIDGLLISNISGKTTISCSIFKENKNRGIKGYGLHDVSLIGSDYDREITVNEGSVFEEISGCGSKTPPHSIIVPTSEIPPGLTLPVTGNEAIPLACGVSWTTLVLPDNNSATFTGTCGGDTSATITPVGNSNLPGVLPDGFSFGGSFSTALRSNNSILEILPAGGTVRVSFMVPEGLQEKELSILFWDTSSGKWIEIPLSGAEGSLSTSNPGMQVLNGVTVGPDGKVSATLNFSGTFVLVTR